MLGCEIPRVSLSCGALFPHSLSLNSQAILHSCSCHRLCICDSHRHDPSYHEPAGGIERHYRADYRLCTSWTAGRDDDVQDVGIHHYGTGIDVYLRL